MTDSDEPSSPHASRTPATPSPPVAPSSRAGRNLPAAIDVASYGAMMMTRASGAVNDASCCSGVGAP